MTIRINSNEGKVYAGLKDVIGIGKVFGKEEIRGFLTTSRIHPETMRGFLHKLTKKGLLKKEGWGKFKLLEKKVEIIPINRVLYRMPMEETQPDISPRMKTKNEIEREIHALEKEISAKEKSLQALKLFLENYDKVVRS